MNKKIITKLWYSKAIIFLNEATYDENANIYWAWNKNFKWRKPESKKAIEHFGSLFNLDKKIDPETKMPNSRISIHKDTLIEAINFWRSNYETWI